MRNSWRLLSKGCLFINAYYSDRPDNDVLLLERVERTLELVCHICEFKNTRYHSTMEFKLMSIGNTAKYCASRVSSRLRRASGID